MTKSKNNSILVIAGGSILGIVFFLGLISTGAFGQFPSPTQGQGQKVCDLTGQITGNALDLSVLNTSVSHLNVLLDTANCHDRTIFDFSLIRGNPEIPQASLFQGSVKIFVKLYDAGGQLVKDKSFDVTTEIGKLDGVNFEEPLKFTSLNKGETYTVKVFTSWSGSEVKLSKNFTV